MDLALNNLQWLICHKTKPNQTHIPETFTALSAGLRKQWLYLLQKVKTPLKGGPEYDTLLHMVLGSSYEEIKSMKYTFIIITARSAPTRCSRTF